MKSSPSQSFGFLTDWFDWRRRDTKDAVVIFGIAVLAFVAADFYDLPVRMFQFGADYAPLAFLIFSIVPSRSADSGISALSRPFQRNQSTHQRRTRGAQSGTARPLDRAA